MSQLSLSKFVFEQHCIPWKVRLFVRRVVPWWIRRILVYGRVNLNTPEAMDERYLSQGDDFVSMENLYEYIIQYLPDEGKLLDAGCGIAVLLRMIRKNKPNLKLFGIDFSQVAVKRTQEYGFEARLSILPDIPYPDDCFDIIVSTEVLEHLENPEKTVRSFNRVLRKGGLVIVSVPKDMGPDHCIEHVQDFDEKALAELFKENGFQVEHLAVVDREPQRKPGASYVLVGRKVGV